MIQGLVGSILMYNQQLIGIADSGNVFGQQNHLTKYKTVNGNVFNLRW